MDAILALVIVCLLIAVFILIMDSESCKGKWILICVAQIILCLFGIVFLYLYVQVQETRTEWVTSKLNNIRFSSPVRVLKVVEARPGLIFSDKTTYHVVIERDE